MAIKVVPFTEEWVAGVKAFNRRMVDGGTGWGWYETPEDSWIPPRPLLHAWTFCIEPTALAAPEMTKHIPSSPTSPRYRR